MSRAQVVCVVATFGWVMIAGGCMTLRDVREEWGQWTSTKKKQPWQRSADDDFDYMGERRPSRIMARDFQPRNILSTMRVITALGDDQEKAKATLDQGREIYRQAVALHEADRVGEAKPLFIRAANKFREAAAQWPDSALEEDALFLQGDAFFFADDYVMANRAYEGLIAQYSGSAYVDQVEARRFAIAQYWLQVAESNIAVRGINVIDPKLPATNVASEARRILHRIRLDDPTGKLADDATMALGNAFFRAKRYQEAADAYDDLRKSYPGSPHQFNAHLFQIKSLLETYAGPDYDGAPLEKADQLMQAIVKQFPREVEEQEEYLAAEASGIRHMLAARDFQVGKYYEARGENRAAGIYYNAVAERFKDTEIGDEAVQRIAAVDEKPAEPAQLAGWFVDWFPEPKATRPLIPSGSQTPTYR